MHTRARRVVLCVLIGVQQAASLRETRDDMESLMYKISRNPGKSLYRSAASPGCPELKAWDHKANEQAQALLTPPDEIITWAPPKDEETLAALHRRRVRREGGGCGGCGGCGGRVPECPPPAPPRITPRTPRTPPLALGQLGPMLDSCPGVLTPVCAALRGICCLPV